MSAMRLESDLQTRRWLKYRLCFISSCAAGTILKMTMYRFKCRELLLIHVSGVSVIAILVTALELWGIIWGTPLKLLFNLQMPLSSSCIGYHSASL
jgi:hypothetical protein